VSARPAPFYRILMVCTGNICRSPVMERVFVARLHDRLPLHFRSFGVRSAGTWGMTGAAMSPEAAETLRLLGGDPSDFVARAIEDVPLAEADLILTATRQHRAAVATQVASAVMKEMTLREFARLLGPVTLAEIDSFAGRDDPVRRMKALVAAAISYRGHVPAPEPSQDDIVDPYQRPMDVYRQAAADIDLAMTTIFDLLAPLA
jgi:protein-tyrosine phosphatase